MENITWQYLNDKLAEIFACRDRNARSELIKTLAIEANIWDKVTCHQVAIDELGALRDKLRQRAA